MVECAEIAASRSMCSASLTSDVQQLLRGEVEGEVPLPYGRLGCGHARVLVPRRRREVVGQEGAEGGEERLKLPVAANVGELGQL